MKPESKPYVCVCVFSIPLCCAGDIKQKKQALDVMKASEIQPVVDSWDLTCSFRHSYYMLLCLFFGHLHYQTGV